MRRPHRLCLLLSLCLLLPPAAAGAAPAVQVSGDLPRSGQLDAPSLASMGPVEVSFTAHGVPHKALGVPLWKVLASFGLAAGNKGKEVAPADKRLGLRMAVLASASDGFQAVFSTAELSQEIGVTQAYLVHMVDGKPLPAELGAFRLVVPTDKEPSRGLFKLQRLEVIDLRRRLAARKP